MPAGLSLKARALQWLAQREHSRLELRRKLLRHAGQQASAAAKAANAIGEATQDQPLARRMPPTPDMQASIDALLDWLAAHELLSESRFVEARLRARAARHGNLRIRRELAQHGLKLAPEAEKALEDSELARARQVLARKFDDPASGAAERSRRMRFLAGRGFSAEVIRRLLRGEDD